MPSGAGNRLKANATYAERCESTEVQCVANTAAIHACHWVSSDPAVRNMPRRIGISRPLSIARPIADVLQPAAMSCQQANNECWRRARRSRAASMTGDLPSRV